MFLLLRAEDELCEWLMLVGGRGEDALKQNRNGLKSNHSSSCILSHRKRDREAVVKQQGKPAPTLPFPSNTPYTQPQWEDLGKFALHITNPYGAPQIPSSSLFSARSNAE